MLVDRLYDSYLRKYAPLKYWTKKGLKCGEGCEIYELASFGTEPYLVKLGNQVRVNKGVHFITHDGGVWVLRNSIPDLKDIDLFRPINVGNNVHIGNNSIIMPGVTIGNNCIIGCGAIVTKDIPDNSIAVGIPAKVIETIDEYFDKHKKDFVKTKSLTIEEKRDFLNRKFGCEGEINYE